MEELFFHWYDFAKENLEMQYPKTIYVVDPIFGEPQNNVDKCYIDSSDFKEVIDADGKFSLLPSKNENNFKYEWTVTYFKGDQKNLCRKNPAF